jgi:long-chain fatty acid transport protein
MRKKILSAVCILSCIVLFKTNSYASAFQLYEIGTPIVGTAGVGQAAAISDASSAYFNPAAMTLLTSTEFMLGGQTAIPQIHFAPNANTTISGNNGGGAGILSPGIGGFFVYPKSRDLYFGVSVSLPAVGILNYSDGWVGRYTVQDVNFITIGLNPVMAYRVNDNLSVGGGFTVYYAKLDETIATPLPAPLPDGQVEAEGLDDIAGQFNLGLLLSIPSSKTRLGLAYRSQATFNLKGTTRFFRLAATPGITSQIKLPQNIILSLYQPVNPKFALLADLGWAEWSEMLATPIQITGLGTAVIPRNWKNTWRAGIGGQFQVTDALMLQAGVSYDSSPTTLAFRLPDLPMDKQYRYGTGFIFKANQLVSIAASYEYADFGKAPINQVSAFPGTLSGQYAVNRVHFVQISVNAKLDRMMGMKA